MGGVSKLFEIRANQRYKKVMKLPENKYEEYLCKKYDNLMPSRMNFENPATYTQKQQWLKLYDLLPEKTVLSDKYAVRQMIANQIGEEYLIPLISIDGKECFYDAYEINFLKLPEQFVLKCNHGSGYNVIVTEKAQLSDKQIIKIKNQLNKWLHTNYAFVNSLELVYKDIKPCIIIEKYMGSSEELMDYKFLCYSGIPKYVWVDQGRYTHHKRSVFDIDGHIMPFTFNKDYPPITDFVFPENFSEMVAIVKKLCGDFLHVRIDLYSINGSVYFSEFTFSSGSGYMLPFPDEYDVILSDEILIDKSRREINKKYRDVSM